MSESESKAAESFDVVIIGATPGGIMAAVAAAKEGMRVALLERSAHIGGLPANGLGATDIGTRGATGGAFADFVARVRRRYVQKYGESSQQVADCSDGHHFEPHVAEAVFHEMLEEHADRVTVRTMRQFDADTRSVVKEEARLREAVLTARESGTRERYRAEVFIDATYEGDLAAAAGAPYLLGREGRDELGEALAGRIYVSWQGLPGPGSTGMADNAVQAYNYRLCLTRDPENLVPISRPDGYNRAEYVSLIDDILYERIPGNPTDELAFDGIGRVVNMVMLPNGKTDANNQHLAFISTDLPEENWPWPTSGWDWRDRFAQRLRDYTLGLLWFAQNDEALPESFRARCRLWGLAKDEYADNGHFPRQVYVREGRRVRGEYVFSARDALPVAPGARPPMHASSITASHYNLDSHAVRKREPGRDHLDGFFGSPSAPYTVPYGAIVPPNVDGLLTPVPASATHIGFSTLRMEPCWMALGQAAGIAAALSVGEGVQPRDVDIARLQGRLLDAGATLIYFHDAKPDHLQYKALQFFALRAYVSLSEWNARLNDVVSHEVASQWISSCGVAGLQEFRPNSTTRGELLDLLWRKVAHRATT